MYNWDFSGPELDKLRRMRPAEYTYRPRFVTIFFCFTQDCPPFNDRRVRRAFALALDRESLAAALAPGYGIPGRDGFTPPGMPGWCAGAGLPYDPGLGRKLLEEAGFPGGKSLPEIPLVSTAARQLTCEWMAAHWQRNLGVKIRFEVYRQNKYMQSSQGEIPAILYGGWWADYPDPDNYLRVCVYSDNPNWRHPEYEQMLEAARLSTEQAERLAYYREADRILMQEAIIVPVFYSPFHLMIQPRVKNFPTTPVKNPGFWKDVLIEDPTE
jgi:ABC-type transport system substrate-binding protein